MTSRAACAPGRTSASTGASAPCSTTRPSATAPKRAFGGRTAVKVRCHSARPTAPLPIAPWRGRVGGQACMEFHLYEWISFPLSVLPSLPPFLLPCRVPGSPLPRLPFPALHVSLWPTMVAITLLFSARLGERRKRMRRRM